MSTRYHHFWIAVMLLLLAAVLRLWALGTLPPGFSIPEVNTLTITETISSGQIRVFETDGQAGQETLFHIIQAAVSTLMGKGQIMLRVISVWSGMLALALLYALTRQMYSPRAALLALGLMAVTMWPVLLARLSIRETLLPLMTLAVLLALARSFYIRQRVSPEPPELISYTMLGGMVAVSLYLHWFGLVLALLVTLTVAYLFLTRQQISRRAAGTSLFAIAISSIIIIPYVATSLRLPDMNGLAALQAAMMPANLPDSIIGGIAAIFPRGDMNVIYNMPGRPLLGPVSATLFVIGLVQGFIHWRRPAMLIPSLAATLGLIPLLFSTRPGAFPAMAGVLPVIFLIIGRTADESLTRLAQFRPRWRQAVPALAIGLVAVNAAWTGIDLFGAWPRLADMQAAFHAEQGLLAAYLDRTAHEIPSVVCSPHLLDTDGEPGDLRLFDLMMNRPDANLRFVDCANGLILADGGEPQQIVFTDTSIIERIQPDLATWLDDTTTQHVAGLAPNSVQLLDVSTRLQDKVGSFQTTAPTGWAPESPGGAGPVPLPVRFGGNITFLGYQPQDNATFAPGSAVPIITYWRTDGRAPRDLRIFAHVLSDPAAIVAQSSAMNSWPYALRDRDVFVQVNYVVLPDSMPSGQYDLSIGAYRAGDGLRLPIFDGERVRGDRLFLYQITVNTPE